MTQALAAINALTIQTRFGLTADRSPSTIHLGLAPARPQQPRRALTRDLLMTAHALLRPTPLNPRTVFDQEEIRLLAISIYSQTVFAADGTVVESGVLVPLIARPDARSVQQGALEVAAGERRWRAVGLLIDGLDIEVGPATLRFQVPASYPVPVDVRDLSDQQLLGVALAENIHRVHLTELEQADLFVSLRGHGLDSAEIAVKYGVGQATVERRLSLGYGLGREGRRLLEEGRISLRHAHIIAVTTGPLKQTLIRAARDGMSVKEMQQLVTTGSVLVQHALFDVAASGLHSVPKLFDDGLPERFNDPKAALAYQLDTLNAVAQQARDAGDWAEVIGAHDAHVLPEGFAHHGTSQPGIVYVVNLTTGEVHLHGGVYDERHHHAPPGAPCTQPAEPLADTDGSGAVQVKGRAASRIKEATAQQTTTLKSTTLIEALMADPRAALANAAAQMIPLGGAIRVEGLGVAAKRCVPAVQRYVEELVTAFPSLFASYSAGALYLHPQITPEQVYLALVQWDDAALIRLLAFLTSGSAWQAEEPSYTRTVAEHLGAAARVHEDFDLSDGFLEAHNRAALEEMVETMPEHLSPIVTAEMTKRDIKGVIMERAGRLKRAGWHPRSLDF